MTTRRTLSLCGVGLLLVVLIALLALRFPPDGIERGEFSQFLGRFHPLVVHFPIALVILAALLELAGSLPNRKQLQTSTGFVLGLATASAVLAVFLGWLLARNGGYEGRLVTRHMWGGASLAALLVFCCAVRDWNRKVYRAALLAAVCVMTWTSDQGGKLTHGEGFLTEHMPAKLRMLLGISPAPAKQAFESRSIAASVATTGTSASVSVAFFATRVAPIFADRCVVCHGPEKKKGKLRLDSFELVLQGGKDGVIVVPGNAKGSELIRRVTLPRDHKDAMPAEGKPGLTSAEIKVLELWINSGAAKTVAAEEVRDAPPVPSPKPELPPLTADYHPRLERIEALQTELGLRLVPRTQNPRDGLILRTVTAPERCDDAALAALVPLADLIIDAELARTKITDQGLKTLGRFANLRSIDLSHTAVTSLGIAALVKLNKLESLNLTGTSVDDTGILPFRHKPGLRHLYLFETKTTPPAVSTQRR